MPTLLSQRVTILRASVRLMSLFLLACTPDVEISMNRGTAGRDDDTGEPTSDVDTAEDDSGVPGHEGAQWTFLVFMNGDNDLEKWALADVNEMEAVGSTDDVNIVVQVDRSARQDDSDGDWSGARRFRVEKDQNTRSITSPVLADLGTVDSGTPQTVIDFVEWGIANYPAERVAVVLWDHGTGWSFQPEEGQKGISDDFDAGSELSVAEGDVTEVYAAAAAALGRPVDLVGFDACIMMAWEVAWSVAPHGKVMVASQDYEALQGWDYTGAMADLVANPEMSAADLGESIAFHFHEIPDSTQSVLDLGQVPAFTAAISEVADAVIASGAAAEVLAMATEDAQGFDGPRSTNHDALDLLSRLSSASNDAAVDAAIEAAMALSEPLIISNYNQGGRVKNANGLTIYSPSTGSEPPIYQNAPWSADTSWDEMIAAAAE